MKYNEAKKVEFMKNLAEAKKGEQAPKDKILWKANGNAPEGWQLLNSPVVWYNPYTDHTKIVNRREVKDVVKPTDPLWTDDYSYILGAVRWHFPWQ